MEWDESADVEDALVLLQRVSQGGPFLLLLS